jgi:hypothetical protein
MSNNPCHYFEKHGFCYNTMCKLYHNHVNETLIVEPAEHKLKKGECVMDIIMVNVIMTTVIIVILLLCIKMFAIIGINMENVNLVLNAIQDILNAKSFKCQRFR